MNKILPEMPHLTGDVYAPVMPMWFANGLRLFALLFSLGMAWVGYQNWSDMPTFAKVIVGVLAPVLFFSALSSKNCWATFAVNPFFLANHLGMYFRQYDSLLYYIGNKNEHQKNIIKQWLLVPWKNIHHVSVAKVSTSDGYTDGAVFDVNAIDEEVSAFFDADIKDKKPMQAGMKAVSFYLNFPPAAKKVVERVQAMQLQYNRSPNHNSLEQTN